jgi:signal transduction histidine kinase
MGCRPHDSIAAMADGVEHAQSAVSASAISVEQELRRQLDTAQSITHIGNWEWRVASGEVTWSDELYRIYGFEPRSVAITLEFFLSRIHSSERERVEREIQGALRHPGRFAYRERIVRADGALRTLDTVGEVFGGEHGADRLVGTCWDVTEQVAAQVIQAGERRALEMLADGEPLGDILAVLVRTIEQASPDTIASILLLDETGTRVQHGAAPGLPDAYNAAVHGQPIGPRAGSCGTAMFRKQPVIVVDIETDPLWDDWRELARSHGLRSAWSFPILGEHDRVLGTFALYHRAPRDIDDAARELMKRTAHVTGIVLERRSLDEQRRALAGRIEAAREDERTRIAREVHDQLGQALTALKLDVGWLQRRVADAALTPKLDDMARSIDDILRSVRRIAADLRPGILDDVGLRAAIEWQAEDYERRTATPVTVRSELSDVQLERGLATNVFRIFQEALTNIARHAGAHHVEVALGLDHGMLRLEISDDGIGMPEVGPRGTTLGILGMRERAWRLGGECTAKRRVPRGTVVTVVVPLRFPSEHVADAGR